MTASWLAPILVFGLVVFIHELGHFIAAKAFGVYAPRFSIGFGPALFKRRRGETEYRVGLLPIGGYVRMASRLDETGAMLEGGAEEGSTEGQDPNAMIPFGPKPIPPDRWFESKPLHARLVIMLAGVTMNLLLGWAVNVGIQKTYAHDFTTVVDTVLAGRPAAAAGVQAGDSVVAIEGIPVTSWDGMIAQVGASAGKPLRFDLLRKGEPIQLTITPTLDSIDDPIHGKKVAMGKVGLASRFDTHTLSWPAAFRKGTQTTADMGTLIFSSLRRLATRDVPVSDLGGPVAIMQQSVQAAKEGADSLFGLIALISINLAIFNLLPIPILDGGQIVVQLLEAAIRRPLSDRAREWVAGAGLVLIVLLFVTVTFNDLKRLIVH